MLAQLIMFVVVGLALGASAAHAAGENKLPRCFLDITADGKPLGRIVIDCARGAQDGREFPGLVHRRERLWL